MLLLLAGQTSLSTARLAASVTTGTTSAVQPLIGSPSTASSHSSRSAAASRGSRRTHVRPGGPAVGELQHLGREGDRHFLGLSPLGPVVDSAAMKASWGTSTRPTIFIRFLPSFCFSSSLRLRVMSPP